MTKHKQSIRPPLGARVTYIDHVMQFEGVVVAHSDLNAVMVRLDAPYQSRLGRTRRVCADEMQFLRKD